MKHNEILAMSATEQARRLAQGDLSSLELCDLYLSRIAELNPRLHAFTYVAARRARLAARLWDQARLRGRAPRSPLSGVPTAIKDLVFVRGMPSRFGTRGFPSIYSPKDGEIARRMRAAGMIFLGKLTTSEFGAMPVTETEVHPPTRNAFNPDYTAGGSSGGSGTAVASGMVPIAQGSDGAGSIRIPSAIGHLVGLKTGRGVISHIVPPDRQLRLSVPGALTRTCADAAAFVDCTSDLPLGLGEALKTALPKGLVVALSTENFVQDTPPAYQHAAREVAKLLQAAGGAVEERDWLEIDPQEFIILWKRLMANPPVLFEKRLQPVTSWLRTAGKNIPPSVALAQRKKLESMVLDWFGEVDLWVSPTMSMLPPRIGGWKAATGEESFLKIMGMGVYTAVFNISGQPAINVPFGFDDSGVPIGVQIAARRGNETLLLQAARVVEEAVGGFNRLAGVPMASSRAGGPPEARL